MFLDKVKRIIKAKKKIKKTDTLDKKGYYGINYLNNLSREQSLGNLKLKLDEKDKLINVLEIQCYSCNRYNSASYAYVPVKLYLLVNKQSNLIDKINEMYNKDYFITSYSIGVLINTSKYKVTSEVVNNLVNIRCDYVGELDATEKILGSHETTVSVTFMNREHKVGSGGSWSAGNNNQVSKSGNSNQILGDSSDVQICTVEENVVINNDYFVDYINGYYDIDLRDTKEKINTLGYNIEILKKNRNNNKKIDKYYELKDVELLEEVLQDRINKEMFSLLGAYALRMTVKKGMS